MWICMYVTMITVVIFCMYDCFTENYVPEYHAFQKSYGNLVDILKCDPLYRYFVSEGIITMREYEDEINCETNHVKQIKIFLGKVSSSLETEYTKSFYKMLTVMSTHGNAATRDLAANIKDMFPFEQKSGMYVCSHTIKLYYIEADFLYTGTNVLTLAKL